MDPAAGTGTAADTGAGTGDGTAGVQPTTDTTTTAGTGTGTAGTPDVAALQADLDKWKALSRKHEAQSKANADAASAAATNKDMLAKVAEALGLAAGDKAPDAGAITAQLQAAQAAAAQQARENAVLRAASRLAADGDALLDSRAFLAQIAALDPADTAGISEAITTAMKDNPRYGAAGTATPTPPARQASTAGSFDGAPGGQRQWTGDDVNRATPAQVLKAMKDGLLKQHMSSPG